MKILITDYHCASNRGDAAILEGVISSLKTNFPNSKISVMTTYPAAAEIINGVIALRQPLVPFNWRRPKHILIMIYSLIGAFFYKRGISLPLIKNYHFAPYIEASLIVLTGGSYFNDYYTPANLGRFWGLYFAHLLGKRVVLYSQSIGPLRKFPYRQISRYILNKIDLITLREKMSKKVLEDMGIETRRIYVAADAAFAMPLTNFGKMQVRRYEDFVFDNKLSLKVSISVRHWRYYEKRGDGEKKYIKAIAGLADWFIKEKGSQVFFVSTCTGFNGYYNDDRIIAYEVTKYMDNCTVGNPTILHGEYTPQELSEIYGKMDLHVGTRMHSNILALLQGIPVVAIEYEFKTTGIMELFGLEDYVININDIELAPLLTMIKRVLEQKEYIKKRINDNLPQMKAEAEKPAKLIKEFFCNSSEIFGKDWKKGIKHNNQPQMKVNKTNKPVLSTIKHKISEYIDEHFSIRSRLLIQTYKEIKSNFPLKGPLLLEDKPIGSRVLVISPHPDDEVIGCGGTIVKHVRAGNKVVCLYLTDGSMRCALHTLESQKRTEIVKKEASRVKKILGFTEQIFLNSYCNGWLKFNNKIVEEIINVLQKVQPDIVYIPWLLDRHKDHIETNRIFSVVIDRSKLHCECYAYEIWSFLEPNILVDISDCVNIKLLALNAYATALQAVDYVRTTKALNIYRSAYYGKGKGFAEAFFRMGAQNYANLCSLISDRRCFK